MRPRYLPRRFVMANLAVFYRVAFDHRLGFTAQR
jgi:hypothetical protein